jgi:peptidoglycan/xylan/chitin deacetylase (PgdA/CDA1 family)
MAHVLSADCVDVAVALTFDVDIEAGLLGESPDFAHRLTSLSEARYGVVRGLPRLVALLDELEIAATFFVPGETAERHPRAVHDLVGAGHEIAHHGHSHLRSHLVDAVRQRDELARGIAALEHCTGVRPRGYRSPSWELTEVTLGFLGEFGFRYDSSCMADDSPYVQRLPAGGTILELPVHWSLDDWPYFGWTPDTGGQLVAADVWEATWLAEFEAATADRRLVTYTMHPEVVGRGYRLAGLRRLLEAMRSSASVWFATHAQVADRLGVRRDGIGD